MEKTIKEEIIDYLKESDMYYVEKLDEEGFPIDDEANDLVGDLTKVELCDMLIESMEDIAEVQRKRDIEKVWNFFVTTLGDKHNKVPINTGEVDKDGYPIWVYEHEDDFYERLKIAMEEEQ
ncbi:MAG: hypothetical protein KBT34_10755 [Prevotella sp.]|nr:hypothetical protein [Candidatus Prevotella equi]